jgi:L-alanine-DL-glutamate epimerase-like enolase superfamily enzyme
LAAEYITSGGSYRLRQALYGQAFMAEDGWVRATEEPGLGLDVTEEMFDKYYPQSMR